jgi:hypothetical protein
MPVREIVFKEYSFDPFALGCAVGDILGPCLTDSVDT